MTTRSQLQERLILWISMFIINGIGWLLSSVIAGLLINHLDLILRSNSLSPSTWALEPIVIWLLAGCLAGYCIGVFQTDAPAAHDFKSKLWPIATMLGLGAGFVSYGYSSLSNSPLEPVGLFAVLGALIGGIVGGMQWLTLRRRYYRAGWWIPANTIIWALEFSSVFRVQVGFLEAISVLTASALTSFVLVWLFRHPIQQQSAEVSAP